MATLKEIELASSIYHNLHDKGMLTPEEDSMLEKAVAVLEEAGLVDIELASSIYHNLHDKGMLTTEEDSMLEKADAVLEEAGLVDKDGNWIYEKELKTVDEVINDIGEVLRQWPGKNIELIANQILSRRVKYKEDSTFEVEDEYNIPDYSK